MNRRAHRFHRRWLGIAAGIAALIALANLLLPAALEVRTEATISAPAATVFSLVSDFRQMDRWWPSRLAADPNASVTVGDDSGNGTVWQWDSRILGNGREEITACQPWSVIETRLERDGADAGSYTYEFSEPSPGTTHVSWTYRRKAGLNPVARLAVAMTEDLTTAQMNRGLEELSALAERLPPFDFAGLDIEHLDVDATDIALVPASSEPFAPAIADALGEAYFRILDFIQANDLREAGNRISISRDFDGDKLRFDAGVPVSGIKATTPVGKDSVRIARTYEGAVVRAIHHGSYLRLGETHDKLMAYLATKGLERNGDAWEAYVSDPTRTETDNLVTYIYYPVRSVSH